MKIPKNIEPLVQDGVVDDVIRQLQSGKEAAVYLVRCGTDIRCAKVYKEANNRSFRQAAEYKEGRKVKNSRRARAMEKGSRYGRKEQESSWQNAEVESLYRLGTAGVRVPRAFGFYDGVLIMELVTDKDGNAAPRLNDVELEPDQAREFHRFLIEQVVLMLCAGIVHGDLSEFNILVSADGPVIIDLPQAVDAASNNNAERMLNRDLENLAVYFGQYAPELLQTQYGKEIWKLYSEGKLTPETELTGQFEAPLEPVDVTGVLDEIEAALIEEFRRRERKLANDADSDE
jgi:RIO kinase 1